MKLLTSLLDLLFPPHCVACGKSGEWFCAACRQTVTPLPDTCCRHCGRVLTFTGLCRRCQVEPSCLESITSCSAHRDPLRKVIHAFKYGGMRILADSLAELLITELQRHPIRVDVVVAVPLHRARIRERGYNQSALLAQALAKRTGIAYAADALTRVKNTPAQVGLTREQRKLNMSGAFRSSVPLPGQRVLLVDDVCTTGATLEACARVLVASGAQSVRALTLARAIGRYQTILQ